MFYLPAAEKQGPVINCYEKWEEAFRIYVAIFSKANPLRAIQILQYSDDIKKAAKDNTWESVYDYDIPFRDTMDTFPRRNWGIIHSTMWQKMKLKLNQFGSLSLASSDKTGQPRKGKMDLCWKFNREHCSNSGCRFEHRCSYCYKTNHNFNSCKAKRSSSNGNQNNSNNNNNTQKTRSSRDKKKELIYQMFNICFRSIWYLIVHIISFL